jgi:hypothetical protein
MSRQFTNKKRNHEMMTDDYKRVTTITEAASENSTQVAPAAIVHAQWINPTYGSTGQTMCGIDTLNLATMPKYRIVSCAGCNAALKKERQRRSHEGTANYQTRVTALLRERAIEQSREAAQIERNAGLLRKLREICGWVENGSAESVTIGQDDATRDWFLSVGYDSISSKRRSYNATSFESVIDAAYEKEQGKDQ